MNKYMRLPIIGLLLFLQAFGAALADAPVIWGAGQRAQLINSKGLALANGQPLDYQGLRNYIGNTSGIGGNVKGWVGTGTANVGAFPNANFNDAYSLNFYASTNGDYSRYRFTVPPVDYGKLLLMQFDQVPNASVSGDFSTAVFCTASSTYASGLTRMPLSTDASSVTLLPILTGTFKSTFSAASGTPYCELRVISTVANVTHIFGLSSIYVGPGSAVQGAYLGLWQTYTPTVTALGTLAGSTFYYRVSGDSVEISGTIQGGTPTASVATVTLPNSYTFSPFNSISVNTDVGSFITNQGTGTGAIVIPGSSQNVLYFAAPGAGNTPLSGNALTNSVAGAVVSFFARVRVNELIGSGTVNLAQNDITFFAPATSGSFTIGTTTSTAPTINASGSPMPNITTADTTNGTTDFLVLPAGVLQDGDKWSVEVKNNGIWYDGEKLYPSNQQGTASYGLKPYTSGGAVYLGFGRAGYAPNTTLSAVGPAWSSQTVNSIRLRVQKGGQAVSFAAYVPGQSSGLIPAVGLPGATSGITSCSGCVGEYITSVIGSGGTLSTSSTTVTQITIPPGDWDVNFTFETTGVAGLTAIFACMTAAGPATTAGCTGGINRGYAYNGGSTALNPTISINSWRILTASTVTVWLNASGIGAATTIFGATLSARRRD